MPVRLVVTGDKEVGAWLKGLDAAVKANVTKAVNSGANAIRNDAVDSVRDGEKTGAVYGDHQASAPGEAPATDTGELISGITFEIDEDGFGARVRSSAPYSIDLEFGTSHMEARPFLMPALEKNRQPIQDSIVEAYNEAT